MPSKETTFIDMLFPLYQWILRLAVAVAIGLMPMPVCAGDNDSGTMERSTAFGVLHIDNQRQQQVGLRTIAVQAAQVLDEFESTGKIISIEPLLALRERYLLAKAEQMAAKAKMIQATQSLKRQEELFKNGISSKRSLQELEAQKLGDSSLVDAAEVKLAAITSELRLNWGKEVSAWVLSESTDYLRPFLLGQAFLLLVTFPADKTLPDATANVQVNEAGRRAEAQPATLVGKASLSDNSAQGESYFFRLQGDRYRTGMKLSVWMPVSSSGDSGVIVPESAVIWYLDQAYVYIKQGENQFVRRALADFSAAPGGYFIRGGVKPGEAVVTVGAQMLLSEELRQQIPDED